MVVSARVSPLSPSPAPPGGATSSSSSSSPAPACSSSAPASPVAAAAPLAAHLHSILPPSPVVTPLAPAALLFKLQVEGCEPLADTEAAECSPQPPPEGAPRAPVRILHLSALPVREVATIRARGLEWAPRLDATIDPETQTIEFQSLQSACFAKPSAALLGHRQRMRQLPAAIAANEAAMAAAEEQNDFATVGALFVEHKKLKAELASLEKLVPPAKDVVEVRRSMRVPLGYLPLEGQIYHIIAEEDTRCPDEPIISDVHPMGSMRPFPFAEESSLADSKILRSRHRADLTQLFSNSRPLPDLNLLYSGERDGFNAAAFHAKCDHRGPTLTVVRARAADGEEPHIFGGFASAAWASSGGYVNSPGNWLFSLRSSSGKLTKLKCINTPCAQFNHSGYGPTFGNGHDLHINNDMQGSSRCSSLPAAYAPATPGFSDAVFDECTLAGRRHFTVEAIEVFAVTPRADPPPQQQVQQKEKEQEEAAGHEEEDEEALEGEEKVADRDEPSHRFN